MVTVKQILPVVLYNARHECSFAAKTRNKIQSLRFPHIPISLYPYLHPQDPVAKEAAPRMY